MDRTGDVCIIGAGNVGSHLYRWLTAHRIVVSRVLSRHDTHPFIPSSLLSKDPGDLPSGTGLCILALPDDRLQEYIAGMRDENRIWVHTSGSLPMDVLAASFPRHGVFYPLQTFSRSVTMSYDDIPVLIEGCDPGVLTTLESIARRISTRVELMDSGKRKALHVSAVFACNFSNHMLHAAESLLGEAGIPFDLLIPLLQQTLRKAISEGPGRSQTGPAVRGDSRIMEEHLDYLRNHPQWQSLYSVISESIRNNQKATGDEY